MFCNVFWRVDHYMRLFLMVANHRVVQRCDVCDVLLQSILVILVAPLRIFLKQSFNLDKKEIYFEDKTF